MICEGSNPTENSQRIMSNETKAKDLVEVTPEKLAQWRSTVRSFFSTSWVQVQDVIEALEAETDDVPPAPVVESHASPAVPAAAPQEPIVRDPAKPSNTTRRTASYERTPGSAAPKAPQRPASTAPARSGLPQDARLAELARRIEERLRQSKS